MTPGLQWFTRFYGRLSAGRKPIGRRVQLQSALVLGGVHQGLRSLEVRTAPGRSFSEMLQFAKDLTTIHDGFATRSAKPELGLVLHLTKSRGGNFKQGVPFPNWRESHADPQAKANPKGYRYSSYFESKRQETQALVDLLLQFPQTLKMVRGFDICTDELAVPTWVLTPMFRLLRDAGRWAATWWKDHHGESVPPPRQTIHSGEDFVHVLGGLRAVDEVIRDFDLRDGDRIGHGVVLGVDASAWARAAGRIAITKEMRMLDLVWEWSCYTRESVGFEPSRLAWIEDQARALAGEIFGLRHLGPADINGLIHDLNCESMLRLAGFPNLSPIENHPNPLLVRYLTDPNVFRRGHESIWVRPFDDHAALERLQQLVITRAANRGLVVEINPTSNLLIGNLGDLRQHPLWRMRSPIENSERPRLKLAVGSDDPATFASSLPEEFMLLYDALLSAGLGADRSSQWIDDVRRSGLENRFTLAN